MHPKRLLILGNSGSGKSTLALDLVRADGRGHLDLDTLAWLDTEPPERRPIVQASEQVQAFVQQHDRWVIEGCYVDLMDLLSTQADGLIFLDLPIARCQEHARQRPWEPHKYPSKEAQDANLTMLLQWIADYPQREGPLGRPAHEAFFAGFRGHKERRTLPHKP